MKDDELLLPWFANPTLHLHRARQLLGMNFLHGLSSAWELITPFILQAPGASDGSSEIVSVEFCLLLALISSARLKGTREAGSEPPSLARCFKCARCPVLVHSLLSSRNCIAGPWGMGGRGPVCAQQGVGRRMSAECHFEHLMAELEPFLDVSSLWPRTAFQMTAPHPISRNTEGLQ